MKTQDIYVPYHDKWEECASDSDAYDRAKELGGELFCRVNLLKQIFQVVWSPHYINLISQEEDDYGIIIIILMDTQTFSWTDIITTFTTILGMEPSTSVNSLILMNK